MYKINRHNIFKLDTEFKLYYPEQINAWRKYGVEDILGEDIIYFQ